MLINGIHDIGIGVTVTDPTNPAPLPILKVNDQTLTINPASTPSRLTATKGKYVTDHPVFEPPSARRTTGRNVALPRGRKPGEEDIYRSDQAAGELRLTPILLETFAAKATRWPY